MHSCSHSKDVLFDSLNLSEIVYGIIIEIPKTDGRVGEDTGSLWLLRNQFYITPHTNS